MNFKKGVLNMKICKRIQKYSDMSVGEIYIFNTQSKIPTENNLYKYRSYYKEVRESFDTVEKT